MNQEQARNIVRQTLTQSFDKTRFQKFVLELLNEFDESKAQSMAVPDAFAKDVRSCARLGTYRSPDRELLDVLIVNTTEPWKLERTRSALRNFVAHKLKRGDNEKDAALVAFVSPMEKQWRFSYVKMEYATVEKDSGKIGVETRLTPARRFSYIVGEGESCHTAQTRFLDLLEDTDNNPTLSQLEEAFSVEAVTKEFFKKYADLFGEIQKALEKLARKDPAIAKEFDKKNVRTADFAKKLMGQIVFLYFIQKKGWLGVEKGKDWGTGPHDFLRRLARGEYGKYENFFNDILEPLFYDTLATDRGHDAWCKRFNCRIPFLNGGLFEPLSDYDWRKTDIVLSNRLFTNNDRFDDFSTGTGLLDMFDRYNFTVNEAEPLEKEVAIDPEMLGKVFENLIEENLRKGLGSYYTPREIVHYMCQESLINYLDTALNSHSEIIGKEKRKQAEFGDEKSEQTLLTAPGRKDIVPRIDIETFVHLGDQISHYEAVETRYAIKMPKSIETHARLIDEKLANITICDPAVGSGAFPVGMMSEIVRARSALTPYFNDVHERTSYHFKRHAIQDCLYGVDIDSGAVEIAKLRLWLSLVVDEEDVKQIKPLPNLAYKIVSGNSLLGVEQNLFNEKLFGRLEKLKPAYFNESDQTRKAHLKTEIDELIAQLTDKSTQFDFRIYFSEVFHLRSGFDVVIANPPYDVLNVTEGHQIERELLAAIRAMPVYDCALGGKLNLFRLFVAKGLEILRKGMSLAYIIPYGFMCDSSSKKLREFVLKEKQLVFVEAFPERDDVNRRLFESAKMSTCIVLIKNVSLRDQFTVRTHYARQIKSDVPTVHLSTKTIQEIDPINYPIPLMDDAELCVVRRMLAVGNRVKHFGRCYEGEVNLTFHKTYLRSQKDGYAKLIKGAAVQRYLLKDRMSQGEIQFLDARRFLRENQGSKSQHHLSRRIIMQGMTGVNERVRLKMTISDEKAFCGNSVNYILLGSQKVSYEYLLAILNSTLLNWYYKLFSTNSNVNGYEVDNLPIAMGDQVQQKNLARLASRGLAAKQRNPGSDTSALEHEIDQLVYALYGLTPEEIKIVEGQTKSPVVADA